MSDRSRRSRFDRSRDSDRRRDRDWDKDRDRGRDRDKRDRDWDRRDRGFDRRDRDRGRDRSREYSGPSTSRDTRRTNETFPPVPGPNVPVQTNPQTVVPPPTGVGIDR
eukprot:UN18245